MQDKKTETVPNEPTKIIIVEDKRKDTQALISNIISGLAVLLAAFAFYYTYLLFGETKTANKTSLNALELARQQFEQSKRDTKETKIEQARKDSEDAINRKNQFVLDSRSTEAQIKSLKETQRQFAIGNEPYLQASIDTIYSDETKNMIYFTLIFKNIGNYPIKIKNYYFTEITKESRPTFNECINKGGVIGWSDSNGEYITKDMPMKKSIALKAVPAIPFNLKNRKAQMFVAGEVQYTNLVKKTTKKYKFLIRTSPYVTNLRELIFNTNIP